VFVCLGCLTSPLMAALLLVVVVLAHFPPTHPSTQPPTHHLPHRPT
jgi:hypothetical protein